MTPLTLTVRVKTRVDLDVTFIPAKRQPPTANRSRENGVKSLIFDLKYLGSEVTANVTCGWWAAARSTSVSGSVTIDRQTVDIRHVKNLPFAASIVKTMMNGHRI